MDIFGTVAGAIDLSLKLKATFEQVGLNKSEGIALSGDIINYLTRIQDHLNDGSSAPSDRLRDDLSEFENALRTLLRRQNALIKQNTGASTSKLKKLYNAGDIKNELTELRQKIQTCRENLQLSCTIRIDDGVASMNEQIIALRQEQEASDRKIQLLQEASDRKIQMLLDALVPGSSPERRATLDHIQENMQERISEAPTNGDLEQDLRNLQIVKEAALSVRSAKSVKESLRSFSASFFEKGLLTQKVKDLGDTIPRLRDQASKAKVGTLLNPFRGLAAWDSYAVLNMTREDSIRETLRILTILRSGERISPINAVRDLLGLARVLGSLGMETEAHGINDWGIQVCRELARSGNMGTLYDLSRLLHKLFMDLSIRGESEGAQRVLSQAVEVRRQLEENNQKSYLSRLSSYVESNYIKLGKLGRSGAAAGAATEAVEILRFLAGGDKKAYLPDLARSLYNLAIYFRESGRGDDAVKAAREAIEMHRELVGIDRKTHLLDLADDLLILTHSLTRSGRYDDAVEARLEYIEMRRELVGIDRSTHLPSLARALFNLAIDFERSGRYEDGIKAGQEAVEISEELAKSNPDKHLPELTKYQNALTRWKEQANKTKPRQPAYLVNF